MGSLAGKSPANTYKSLLKVADETNGVSGTLSTVEDGEGTSSSLSVSQGQIMIYPNSDTIRTLRVRNASGTDLLVVDTSNSVVKVGTSQVSATTQLLNFAGYRIVSGSTSQHMFVPCGGNGFNASIAEINGGTGTDPSTSLDKTTQADETVNMLFNNMLQNKHSSKTQLKQQTTLYNIS